LKSTNDDDDDDDNQMCQLANFSWLLHLQLETVIEKT
jgi:hypothetical protein